MTSGFPGLPGTDSTAAGEEEASPGFTGNDIMSSGFPGDMELIILILLKKRYLQVLLEKI